MKTIFYAILLVAMFLFIAQTKFSLKPFNMEFKRPYEAVGWLFLMLAIILIGFQKQKDGYTSGYKDAFKDIEKVVDKHMEEKH